MENFDPNVLQGLQSDKPSRKLPSAQEVANELEVLFKTAIPDVKFSDEKFAHEGFVKMAKSLLSDRYENGGSFTKQYGAGRLGTLGFDEKGLGMLAHLDPSIQDIHMANLKSATITQAIFPAVESITGFWIVPIVISMIDVHEAQSDLTVAFAVGTSLTKVDKTAKRICVREYGRRVRRIIARELGGDLKDYPFLHELTGEIQKFDLSRIVN